MPSLYEASQSQPFREDEGVTAGSLRDKARPANLKTGFFEPGNVGRTIGVAPVHRRAMPIVLGASPGTGSHRREQVPAGSEPPVDVPEDRRLLIQRQVDDGIEGDDRSKAV